MPRQSFDAQALCYESKDKDYKWAYSRSKGYYIGMKLVLALEYPSLKPLAFLVFPGGPSDSKIFDEIVAELIRRK